MAASEPNTQSAGALPEGDLDTHNQQHPQHAPDQIHLYNTTTRRVEPFEPIEPNTVKLYVCGISTSGPPHVGHGRSYVVFDVLRRVLEHAGYNVQHVQNFTDIEEPIVRRAKERGIEPIQYAREMEQAYFDAMDRLDVLQADAFPRVTDYMDTIIEATQTLENHECAYAIDDGVAFRVCDIQGFGELLGRDPMEAIVSTVTKDQINGRENPFDFVLWRNRDDVGITWETPWGEGRPGWHTECAVMATDLLGDTIDIHGGGQDLIFPHHESERAIARCLTNTDFVRYWVHNGLVRLGEDKMSKSLRNTVPLNEAINEHGPATIRTAYLLEPYRETIEWTPKLLDTAHDTTQTLHEAYHDATPGEPSTPLQRLLQNTINALRNDLNTPHALTTLQTLATDHKHEPGAKTALHEALTLLGLANLPPFNEETPNDENA